MSTQAVMANPDISDSDEPDSLVHWAATTALKPVGIATSRTAVKAYLSTFLFLLTSLSLLGLSTIAFGFFYYSYIPQIDLERPIYLQYGLGTHPHATIFLDTNALVSSQPYDIELNLHMPRTPANLAAGNFMLDLALLSQGPPLANKLPDSIAPILPNITTGHNLLYHSRRPAIVPYSSPILSVSHTILNLPWHLLRFRDLDSAHITVSMFERLSFPRGYRNIPTHIRVELQAQPASSPASALSLNPLSTAQSQPQTPKPTELQVYTVSIAFRARFQGLRWVLYNHRVLAFLAFSTIFYFTSLLSLGLAWTFFSSYFSPNATPSSQLKLETPTTKDGKRIKNEKEIDSNGDLAKIPANKKIKSEDEDDSDLGGLSLSNLSDNGAQFPSGRGQMPLRYAGRQSSSSSQIVAPDPIASGGVRGTDEAADDEDEDEQQRIGAATSAGRNGIKDERDGDRRFDDSGIGTSLESENVPSSATGGSGSQVRRRGSRQSLGR